MERQLKFRAWDGDDSKSHKDGEYTYVKAQWHPHANRRGYVKRHRLVLEQKLGYYLPKNSIVHHINKDKRDDRLENLEYHPDQKFHAKSHDNGKRNGNGQFVATDPIFTEIKFRLFNKHTGLYEFFTLGQLIKTTFRNSQFKFAGRFTGLLDRNGKEIYEGDIVEMKGGQRGVVEWCEELALYQVVIQVDGEEYTATIYSHQEDNRNTNRKVIGNIYENPDLLQ